jgi:hypothetical protein
MHIPTCDLWVMRHPSLTSQPVPELEADLGQRPDGGCLQADASQLSQGVSPRFVYRLVYISSV